MKLPLEICGHTMSLKIKPKWALSHYGEQGPRSVGLILRLETIGFTIFFWKWYFDFRLLDKAWRPFETKEQTKQFLKELKEMVNKKL